MQVRTFRRRLELADYLGNDPEVGEQTAFEAALAVRHREQESFVLDGWCRVCEAATGFVVDRQFGGRETADGWIPSWRERLACERCGLNNRQRAVAAAVRDAFVGRDPAPEPALYAMEQISPTFQWLCTHLEGVSCTGSEYLGEGIEGGTLRDGVLPGLRHEDVERLSFGDRSFDVVISNDVLEHVVSPAAALSEVHRVLRPGGELIFSVPFWIDRQATVRRAERSRGEIRNLLPAVYHGDPMSAQGSLVFHDFGWDLLDLAREAGFDDVFLRLYWSYLYGHLGCPAFYFVALRAAEEG